MSAPQIGPGLAEAAALVDSLVSAPVLVHGSLGATSRDLDLLARPEQESELVGGLAAAGFERSGLALARFRAGSVELVDIVPAREWALPDAELESLFADATPVDGYERIVRPSPHHVLVSLARRIVEGSGRLDAKRRSYVDRALAEDPQAWEHAAAHADAWGGPAALRLLERAYRGEQLRLADRASAMVDRQLRRGVDPARARINVWRHLLRPPRLGHVITLSGIDGSGKSTQGDVLADTLGQLGYEATPERRKLAEDAWLWKLRPLVARAVYVLTPARRRPTEAAAPELSPEPAPWGEAAPLDAATLLRERSALLSHGWVSLIAAANVVSHQRAVLAHVLRGRVVICDRYTLDSIVHLRMRFGDGRSWDFERRLVRALSPRPLRSYFLDLPPEVAQARKLEDELDWLTDLAARYRAEYGSVGAVRIDAELPRDEVAALLARDAWLALSE